MKELISFKTAGNILIVIMGLLLSFHILTMTGIFPINIIWGGRIENTASALIYESAAFLLNILFLTVVLVKIKYIKITKFQKAVSVILWIIFAYMVLNTIGNLFSASSAEKLIFTPITMVMALLVLRLAVEKS